MKIISLSILFLVSIMANAQTINPRWNTWKEIKNIFSAKELKNVLQTQESAFYTFSVRVHLLKSEKGRVKVLGISANDSTIVRLYPDYIRNLRKINFSVFMRGRKNAVMIIPVALEIAGKGGFSEIKTRSYFNAASDLFDHDYFRIDDCIYVPLISIFIDYSR